MSVYEKLEKMEIHEVYMKNLEMLLLDYRLLPKTYKNDFRNEVLSNIQFITHELISDIRNDRIEKTGKTYIEDRLIKGIYVKNERNEIVERV